MKRLDLSTVRAGLEWWEWRTTARRLQIWTKAITGAAGSYSVRFDPHFPHPGGQAEELRIIKLNPAAWTAEMFVGWCEAVERGQATPWLGEIPSLADFQWACCKAVAAHEVGHARFSGPLPAGSLLAWVDNLLDDERVELGMARLYPVLARYFHLVGDVSWLMHSATDPEDDGPFQVLHAVLLYRWEHDRPGWESKIRLSEANQARWEEVRPVVEGAWVARTPEEVTEAAREILRILGLPEHAELPEWLKRLLERLAKRKPRRKADGRPEKLPRIRLPRRRAQKKAEEGEREADEKPGDEPAEPEESPAVPAEPSAEETPAKTGSAEEPPWDEALTQAGDEAHDEGSEPSHGDPGEEPVAEPGGVHGPSTSMEEPGPGDETGDGQDEEPPAFDEPFGDALAEDEEGGEARPDAREEAEPDDEPAGEPPPEVGEETGAEADEPHSAAEPGPADGALAEEPGEEPPRASADEPDEPEWDDEEEPFAGLPPIEVDWLGDHVPTETPEGCVLSPAEYGYLEDAARPFVARLVAALKLPQPDHGMGYARRGRRLSVRRVIRGYPDPFRARTDYGDAPLEMVVDILGDRSGSMGTTGDSPFDSGPKTDWGLKIAAARLGVMMLHLALEELHVPHAIHLFDDHVPIKPDYDKSGEMVKALIAGWQGVTGEEWVSVSMETQIPKLLARPEPIKVMLIVHDGYPVGRGRKYGSDAEGIVALQQKHKRVIWFIGVYLGDQSAPWAADEIGRMKQLFPHLVACSPEEFPAHLGRLLRQLWAARTS